MSVEVVSYNSKVYYVQGDVGSPGRLPITGNETVLDGITYAGGLLPPGRSRIRLVRPAPPGACCEQVLPVDLDAIIKRGDPSTNYQVFPGDRILAEPAAAPAAVGDKGARRAAIETRLDALIRELESLRGEIRKDP